MKPTSPHTLGGTCGFCIATGARLLSSACTQKNQTREAPCAQNCTSQSSDVSKTSPSSFGPQH
eukprot:2950920-Amphidinium_carterae.1